MAAQARAMITPTSTSLYQLPRKPSDLLASAKMVSVLTSDMVAEILCDGKSAAEMPYQTFDNGIVTINTETAAALGFEGDKLDALKEAFKPYCTEIVEVTTAENFS